MKNAIAVVVAIGMQVFYCGPVLADDGDPPDVNCSKLEPGGPQIDRNNCAEQRFDAADKALNDAYKKAMEEAKADDADIAETNPNLVGAVDALKKAERGWIAYRDGYCEGEAFGYRGGSGEYETLMNCKTDLSEKRAKQLTTSGNY